MAIKNKSLTRDAPTPTNISTNSEPEMEKKGYPRDFATAVTVSGSVQAILIPPSHNAVIYSLAAGGSVSIAALFLAGEPLDEPTATWISSAINKPIIDNFPFVAELVPLVPPR